VPGRRPGGVVDRRGSAWVYRSPAYLSPLLPEACPLV
jgi:hypothetical protein